MLATFHTTALMRTAGLPSVTLNTVNIVVTVIAIVVTVISIYLYFRPELPSLGIEELAHARYYEGDEVLYDIEARLRNTGDAQATVTRATLSRQNPDGTASGRDDSATLDIENVEIEAGEASAVRFEGHGPPLVDEMLERKQPVEALLVIESGTDELRTEVTLTEPYG